MNQTIRTQLAHRTIREFTAEPIPEETMEQLFEVAMHAATSRGLQHASIIRVQDQAKRDQLAVIGNQEYVARAPEYLMFIVDANRSARVLEEAGMPSEPAGSMEVFTEGFTDAILMAQNVVVAAETLGLGANYLGNVLNDPAGVVKLLNLPKYTFPAVGVTLGHPNQEPQLKPRMETSLRVMVDEYRQPDSMTEALANYDQAIQTYYDLRDTNRRLDSFTNQIRQKVGAFRENRAGILNDIRAQGFDLRLAD